MFDVFCPIFWGLVSPKKIPKTSTHLAQHGRPQRSTIQGDDLQTENAMITLLGLWNQLLNINIYIYIVQLLNPLEMITNCRKDVSNCQQTMLKTTA